jgi:histidinol-phosphate aminotransferase
LDPDVTYAYEKPPEPIAGLRLHMNENTGGCSPAVLKALRSLTAEQLACYPDYSNLVPAVADRLGVPVESVALTNGLDEGILAASLSAARRGADGEAIVIVPAFEMQPACAEAAGLRIVEVPLGPDFTFPADAVLRKVGPSTRIVFITSPHNPTGRTAGRRSVVAIAEAAPEALVFVDEAYADFAAASLLDEPPFAALPNVIVGRTFAKAYGLAGLRCGALTGSNAALAPIRNVLPPYNVNAAAAAAVPAALGDRDHYEWYVDQVQQSRQLVYDRCDRLGIQYWKSAGNFVLVRVGADASRVCGRLARREIHVRDRSSIAGCDGCVRITAGVVAHTARCLDALEEALCGGR